MSLLRCIKNHVRGWLPKEPSFQNSRTVNLDLKQKTKMSAKTRLALTFTVIFAAVFGTLSVLDVIGLRSYAPFFAGAAAGFASAVLNVWIWKREQRSKHREVNRIGLKQ
jgi:hypothetical protein